MLLLESPEPRSDEEESENDDDAVIDDATAGDDAAAADADNAEALGETASVSFSVALEERSRENAALASIWKTKNHKKKLF